MNEIPYWKRKGYRSEQSYVESKKRYKSGEKYRAQLKRARKKTRTPTGYYTLYLIYKEDKSEFYIGQTKSKLRYRKEKHFAKSTNISSPFTGKSAKQYKAVVLHTCATRKEALDIESRVISNLTSDVRMLNKRGR